MKKKKIAVIGAGIVGVTAALELQRRGYQTTLLDSDSPGSNTSHGNAGVLSDASILIINNPELFGSLPKYLFNDKLGLRYDIGFILSRFTWMLKFLSFANSKHKVKAAKALRKLQVESLKLHTELVKEAGIEDLLEKKGYLKLYRTQKGYDSAKAGLSFLKEQGVVITEYSSDELKKLEPALKPIFYRGALLSETYAVSSPKDLTQAYARLFESLGGQFIQSTVTYLNQGKSSEWQVSTINGQEIYVDDVIVCTGPWSKEFISDLGYKIPMAWERGYHQHLSPTADTPELNRPLHDVEGACVIAKHKEGLRVLSGVELTYRDAEPNFSQINTAITNAREVIDMGSEVDEEPWLGKRPTLPDSLPMVGAASKHKGLWFNFGHQHVGLTTSTGCAKIIANLIDGNPANIENSPFSPNRFKI